MGPSSFGLPDLGGIKFNPTVKGFSMFRNEGRGTLIRERLVAIRPHGDEGEQLRVSIIRLGPGEAAKVELRQWNPKPDGSVGPTCHGLRFPMDMAGWLGRELAKLATENESADEDRP
jgi:hypothetical protein